ncbi:MAG: exodeoxyribonuclease III [Fusobacteriota bacterium]
MELVSWNVNGLRAAVRKGFEKVFKDIDADIFSLQEIRLQEGQIDLDLNDYNQYWNYGEKKGYSGTAIFTKEKPISVKNGIGIEKHDKEGRVMTAEYPEFYLVNVYTPNSKRGLKRLDYRMEWQDDFKNYILNLEKEKPVIVCGDLNVAHKEIDIENDSTNHDSAGFTDEEREKMSDLLEAGYIDSFRYFYPEKEKAYSWWSYMRKARDRNVGWRLDYFIVSEKLAKKMEDANIYSDIMGSDHCPVSLKLKD